MSEEMTREEHLALCKERALRYVDIGQLSEAFASLTSDLNKHPETEHHSACELGMMLLMNGHLDTRAKMEAFINGVH